MREPKWLHLLHHGLKLSCVLLERIESKFWAIAVLHAEVSCPGISSLNFVLEKKGLHDCLDAADCIGLDKDFEAMAGWQASWSPTSAGATCRFVGSVGIWERQYVWCILILARQRGMLHVHMQAVGFVMQTVPCSPTYIWSNVDS